MGLIILFFVLYIAFGRYGNVTLGKATDRPEFNNFSWASMLFCAGIGSDILYWGVIEWAFYYQVPPNGAKGTWDVPLGTNRMGNLCVARLPIGVVKKQPIYKISQACRPVLKGQTDKFLGKLVDILFILD